MVLIGLSGHLYRKPKKASIKTWTISNFRLNGTAWTFSGTICVGRAGDESCDLVEITKVKFMEAQGAHDLPPAIQYLPVHCEISQLALIAGSGEVTKVPVRCFLQIATTSGIPGGNAGFLTSSGVRCGEACVAMRSSKKPWPRYIMTLIMMEPVLYGSRCSSRESSGGTTRAAARPGRLLRRRSPRARDQAHPPPLDR